MYIEQTAELIMAAQMVGFWMIFDWAKLNEYYYVTNELSAKKIPLWNWIIHHCGHIRCNYKWAKNVMYSAIKLSTLGRLLCDAKPKRCRFFRDFFIGFRFALLSRKIIATINLYSVKSHWMKRLDLRYSNVHFTCCIQLMSTETELNDVKPQMK